MNLLDAMASLIVASVGALLAWRTGAAVVEAFDVGETTMILGLPLWPGPALMVPGFLLLSLAGLYRCALHLRRARRGGLG